MIAYRYFKRKKLNNDLWFLRVITKDIFSDCDERNGLSDMRKNMDVDLYDINRRKKIVQEFVNLLSDHQAKSLKTVVEEKGAGYGDCLMLPCCMTVRVSKAHSEISPLLLTCQVWRWNDLEDTKELCRLSHVCSGHGTAPNSSSAGLKDKVAATSPAPETANHLHHRTLTEYRKMECCNPYHWARQVALPGFRSAADTEMVQQEKSLLAFLPHPGDTTSADKHSDDAVQSCDPFPTCSTETGISTVYGGQPSVDSTSFATFVSALPGGAYANHSSPRVGRHHWCVLQYWEEKEHIGTNFKVVDPVFNVLYGMPSPLQKGLRLDQFENKKVGKTRNVDELRVDGNASRLGKDEKTKKLRESIGLGYSLILDEAGRQICIYNRGNLPLFVSSAYLIFQYRAEGEEVVKVKPGYSIKAFDLDFRPPGGFTSVPSSPCSSIYVSFGKGWGPGYKRKEVLGCNCWMEICLNKFTQKQSR